MKSFQQLREALDRDVSSMDDRSVAAIASNPKHPMHSAAKAEHDRRKMKQEEKDPEEYDNEGSMMKSQLRQICSANEKLMGMVKDDENLPEWVQSKVTKATDYIRSVRDYLESEKMEESFEWVCGKCNCEPCTCGEEVQEKTLTPAEKKKREEIAKAMERENPGMDKSKKMAIATATAKRVAEAEGTAAKYAGKSGMFGGKYTSKDHLMTMKNMQSIRKKRQDQRDAEHKKQDPKMAKMGYAKHMMDTDKADAKARKRGINPDGQYDKYKKKNNIKDSTQVDEVLDTPKAMQSYKDKAKYSKDRATSSAAAKILRGPDASGKRADHSPELKTMNKRDKGLKMADKSAVRKTLKKLRSEEKDTHVTKDGRTAKKGLWYNIHQKRKRGEAPAKPGDPDRPSMKDMKRSQK